MRIATSDQSRRIDHLSQKEYSLPAEVLMEAAGSVAAREIEQSYLPELRTRRRVVVVCGPGNNGGDGLVVARHLHSAGWTGVSVALQAPLEKRSALFDAQLERCVKSGVPIVDLLREGSKLDLSEACLAVDALFGIGLSSEIRSPYRELIETMNASRLPIISLDSPSGLDTDRGVVLGAAVRAAQTITFGLAKPGFFVSQGPEHVGRLKIAPIGFPREAFKQCADTHFAVTERLARRSLPKRPRAGNKTHFGHVLMIAGSPGMMGAALLSATSAFRMGAGYVTLGSQGDVGQALASFPEILTADLADEAFWSKRKFTAVGIGPGLGTGARTEDLIRRLKEIEALPVVADADAITVIAAKKLYPLPPTWILTPHAGELSRLTGRPSQEIESDRYASAREAAALAGCTVLLKGYRTVIAQGERCGVVLSGNAALAKAGTGDVLTGMIAALLAQRLSPMRAAGAAAYVHGRIADEWVRAGNDKRSMEASDIRDILPGLLARL